MLEMWCKIIVLKTRKYDNTPVLKTLNRTASILTLARVVMDEKKLILSARTHSFCELSFHGVKIHILYYPTKDLWLIFSFSYSLFSKCQPSIPCLLFRVSNLICSCLLIGVLYIHQCRSQPRTPLMNTTSESMSALPPGDMLRCTKLRFMSPSIVSRFVPPSSCGVPCVASLHRLSTLRDSSFTCFIMASDVR